MALNGQPAMVVLGTVVVVLLFWKGPEYLKIVLEHRRERYRINAEVLRLQKQLDHEIETKRQRSNRKK
jgi:hypothetical protein